MLASDVSPPQGGSTEDVCLDSVLEPEHNVQQNGMRLANFVSTAALLWKTLRPNHLQGVCFARVSSSCWQ